MKNLFLLLAIFLFMFLGIHERPPLDRFYYLKNFKKQHKYINKQKIKTKKQKNNKIKKNKKMK